MDDLVLDMPKYPAVQFEVSTTEFDYEDHSYTLNPAEQLQTAELQAQLRQKLEQLYELTYQEEEPETLQHCLDTISSLMEPIE